MTNIFDFFRNIKKAGCLLDQPAKINQKVMQRTNEIFPLIWDRMVSLNTRTDVYGITLTLVGGRINDNPVVTHIYVKNCISKYLTKNIPKLRLILFPEFNDNGYLHYHGVIYGVYQCDAIRFKNWYARTFAYAKLEKELRYYICHSDRYKCIQNKLNKNAEWCWLHYVTKDLGKTGLSTITLNF